MIKVNGQQPIPFNSKQVQAELDKGYGLRVDLKADGVRAYIILDKKTIIGVVSRSGKDLPALQFLVGTNVRQLVAGTIMYEDGFIIDCELTIDNKTFEEISGTVRTKDLTDRPLFIANIINILPLDILTHTEPLDIPFETRVIQREFMVTSLNAYLGGPSLEFRAIKSNVVYDMDELMKVFEATTKLGHEGLVLYAILGKYTRGKKAGVCWKMKTHDTIDGTIKDVVWGTKGLAYEDSVIGFEVVLDDGTVVSVTGISDSLKDECTKNPELYIGRIVEVSYMERTANGSLRHPSFKAFRDLIESKGEKL